MSNSLKKRIGLTLLVTIFLFMFNAILWKAILGKEEWLQISLVLTLAWGTGLFLKKTIDEIFLNHEEKGDWVKLLIIICCSITIFFVTGVILEMPNDTFRFNIAIIGTFSTALFLG